MQKIGSWSLCLHGVAITPSVLFLHEKLPHQNVNSMRHIMKSEYDFSKGKRGALDPIPTGKTRITIRIDEDILDWFRREVDSIGGGNYQTLMNQALREYILHRQEPLEEILRRVVREELHSMSS
jgi:uncharacterized protein (DUF4415 family)